MKKLFLLFILLIPVFLYSQTTSKGQTPSSVGTSSGGGMEDLVDDVTPQLGGYLDFNSKGITEEFTAGETLSAGDLCYLKDDKFWLADADAEATSDTQIVIATESISAEGTGTFLLFGKYTTSGLTAGDMLYISTTAGDWTSTAPSASGDIVRPIGYALSTTVLFFNPDHTYIEL